MNFNEIVNALAAGKETTADSAILYWDDQDAANAGPAYRVKFGEDEFSGPLELEGWSSDVDGYELAHYFDAQGEYKGPDAVGVYPIFSA